MTDKLPWLALRSIPGVGLVLFQRLLAAFGSPAAVFQAGPGDLRSVRGISPAMAQAILKFSDWDRVEGVLARAQAQGVEVLTQGDAAFPARLRNIPYPPPFLFVKGSLTPAEGPAVALVGTRNPRYYGLKASRRLAQELGERGVTVVYPVPEPEPEAGVENVEAQARRTEPFPEVEPEPEPPVFSAETTMLPGAAPIFTMADYLKRAEAQQEPKLAFEPKTEEPPPDTVYAMPAPSVVSTPPAPPEEPPYSFAASPQAAPTPTPEPPAEPAYPSFTATQPTTVLPEPPQIPSPAPPSRPSQEDLAALDALLNPASAGSRTASERPRQERFEPQSRPPTTPPRKVPAPRRPRHARAFR